ncbi:MAG TPA: YIP1 family protein [Acidobacteriaceae bacterium]|jgi:hypothetical protein
MEEVLVPGSKPLSEVERVVDTFIAPSKTFTDILRSASWWLPYVLAVIVSLAGAFAISQKIGFETVAQTQVEKNPKAEERMSQLTPEQRAKQIHISAIVTKAISYSIPVVILIISLFATLLLWASFNFILGAQTKFSQMLAVWMFASLPRLLMGILNIILLYAGVGTENYDVRNPVGTNLAYYVPDASPVLKALLSFIDIFGLWNLFLLVLGTSIISRKSKGASAAVVVGWWLVGLVLSVASAAIFG